MWTKQIELVSYDQVKNSFFLVFRKLICSPNLCERLSKVKEPHTTDHFLFVSDYNVRLSFLLFWRLFVSVFWILICVIIHSFSLFFVFLCFSRNFCRVIRNEFYLFFTNDFSFVDVHVAKTVAKIILADTDNSERDIRLHCRLSLSNNVVPRSAILWKENGGGGSKSTWSSYVSSTHVWVVRLLAWRLLLQSGECCDVLSVFRTEAIQPATATMERRNPPNSWRNKLQF